MKSVDYSAQAVARRLKRASDLRDLCLALAKAGRVLREPSQPQIGPARTSIVSIRKPQD